MFICERKLGYILTVILLEEKKEFCIKASQRRPEGRTTETRNTRMEETSSGQRRMEACSEEGQGPEGAVTLWKVDSNKTKHLSHKCSEMCL
jgi:hypothetical protein